MPKTIIVKLTDVEWADRAAKHAETCAEIALKQELLKELQKTHRDEIKLLKEREVELRQAVRTRQEEREIDDQLGLDLDDDEPKGRH